MDNCDIERDIIKQEEKKCYYNNFFALFSFLRIYINHFIMVRVETKEKKPEQVLTVDYFCRAFNKI